MSATWGLIGYGNIGKEIQRQINKPDVAARLGLNEQPAFIATSKGILNADGTPSDYKSFSDISELPDVNFLAIPSSDDGKAAFAYISAILAQGKLAVTAEKGGLANFFDELKTASDNFKRLGITATVGGGTRVMQVAKEYTQDIQNITQIHLVLNGTLAAIMEWVAPVSGAGISLEEAAKQAVELGYAEPGSSSAEAIIRGEAEGDIPKKLSIFCNAVGLCSETLDWNKVRFSLTSGQIAAALSSSKPRRFVVSLYPQTTEAQNGPETDIIGGFNVSHDGWKMVGGFRRTDANPLFGALSVLTGPGNGMVIGLGPDASDGVYAVTGPGAGVSPTVNTMIDDYLRLKN